MLLQSSLQIINFGYYYFYRILLCVMSYLLLINTVRWRWFDLPAMVRTRWSCSFNFLPIFWKKIVSPYCFNLQFPDYQWNWISSQMFIVRFYLLFCKYLFMSFEHHFPLLGPLHLSFFFFSIFKKFKYTKVQRIT